MTQRAAKRLGAIIAGGKASRFGGDKGAALVNGRALLDRVADGMRNQVDHLIICGREWPGLDSVPDRPDADLGPLGGLNAALHFAQHNGFDNVATAGCDVLPVAEFPADLAAGEAAYIEGHYLFGIWPASLASTLDQHLIQQSDRSMRHWIAITGAHALPSTVEFRNLNTPDELTQYSRYFPEQAL